MGLRIPALQQISPPEREEQVGIVASDLRRQEWLRQREVTRRNQRPYDLGTEGTLEENRPEAGAVTLRVGTRPVALGTGAAGKILVVALSGASGNAGT